MTNSSKTKIILAVLGLLGGLGGAVVANWDKLNNKPEQIPQVATFPNVQGVQIIQGSNNMQISGSNNVIKSSLDDDSRASFGTLDAKTSAIESKTDVLERGGGDAHNYVN